jgi:thymidylate synthase (FAD)
MNIVKPSYTIYNDNDFTRPFVLVDGLVLLRKIEYMARISHGSEESQTATSYDRFLRNVVLSKGDWSVVEHASLTVIFFVDRGITHELVRHRLFSITQSSTRFINYTKKIEPSFIKPEGMNELSGAIWTDAIIFSEAEYKRMIKAGCTPQIARSVFPNALGSRIAMTCNLRNWRHLLLMRSTREAHPQMRQVIDPLLEEMKSCIPILFEDIEAGATQADNLKKMR